MNIHTYTIYRSIIFLTTLFVNWHYAQSILMQYFPTNLSSSNHHLLSSSSSGNDRWCTRKGFHWCQESSAWNTISWARFETTLFSNEMRIYTMILYIVLGISWHRYHQIYDLENKDTRTLLIVCKLFHWSWTNAFQIYEIVRIFVEDFYRINKHCVLYYTFTLHFRIHFSFIWRFLSRELLSISMYN